jgi:hypothetical protein
MFTQKTLAAAAAIALLPVGAFAGEFSATAGFEASIDFDNDLDPTGDAVELSLGAEYAEGGFTAGVSATFADGATDEVEYELALGYGGDLSDVLSYSAGLSATWLDDSDYQGTEAELGFSYAFTDDITGSYTYTNVVDAPAAVGTEGDYSHEVAVEIAVGDWTVEPVISVDQADVVAYELNFGYEFESGVSVGIEFADDDTAGTKMTGSLIFGYEIDLI